VDFVSQTERYTRTCLEAYTNMQDVVQQNRQSRPPPNILDEYCGDYYDATGIFFIRVRRNPNEEQSLQLLFQGQENQAYNLRYFRGDTFEWTLTQDETAKRARYHQFDQNYFNFDFKSGQSHKVESFTWKHDPFTTSPETFTKK
jgi:hypothetical protein